MNPANETCSIARKYSRHLPWNYAAPVDTPALSDAEQQEKGSSHPSETIHMAQKAFPKTIFRRNFIIL